MSSIPSEVLKLNIANMNKGKHAALLGEAHQFIATGILMRLGFGVSVVSVRGGAYDLIIPAYEDFDSDPGRTVLIKAQTRTMTNSLKFIGGTRAGVNRIYIPGVKTYKYTEKDNDLILGVDKASFDLYLVPTRHIAKWGTSRSKALLQIYKNNWDILLHWNDAFLKKVES